MKAKRKILIANAFFAVSAMLLLAFVAYPMFQGVLTDYEKVLTHQSETLQLKEDKKNSREFEIISSQYAGEFAQLKDLLVDSETPIMFFRFLDDTAASLGLRIEKAPSSVQSVQGDRWPSFDMRLTGEGLYPDFMTFLQKIENAPYLLEVKTLTLSAKRTSEDQQSQGEIEFSLSLKVFTK